MITTITREEHTNTFYNFYCVVVTRHIWSTLQFMIKIPIKPYTPGTVMSGGERRVYSSLNSTKMDTYYSALSGTVMSGGEHHVYSSLNSTKMDTYYSALEAVAGQNRVAILIYVDFSYLDMALNLINSSIKPLHMLDNVLFVSTDTNVCQYLSQQSVYCFVYIKTQPVDGSDSVFDSKGFIEKMNIRTEMILDALRLGYTVLHTDADVVFFLDPLPEIIHACADACDMAAMLDIDIYNAGFVFLKSRQAVIAVYRKMQHLYRYKMKDDQTALNEALVSAKHVNMVDLSVRQFQSGIEYFENDQRGVRVIYHKRDCVVVHNNWMVGRDAKIYRFRETGLWTLDFTTRTDKKIPRYYTDTSRKYLSFEIPTTDEDLSDKSQWQMDVLTNALIMGHILIRTVILPTFTCGNSSVTSFSCDILHFVDFRQFHNYFWDAYREHTSFENSLIPQALKNNRNSYTLKFTTSEKFPIISHGILYVPINSKYVPSIITVNVMNLKDVHQKFPTAILQNHYVKEIVKELRESIKFDNYRQYSGQMKTFI